MTYLTSALLTYALATPEYDALKQLLERPWEGEGVQSATFTSSGKLVTRHTLQLKANETLNLSGTFQTILILDNVTYKATYDVSAEYLSTQQSIVVNGRLSSHDTLPHGLIFCSFTGKLQLGNDTSRPGHYGMKGGLDYACDARTELVMRTQ